MSEVSDRELLRLLAGELGAEEAERLERRLAGDARLVRRYDEWRRLWRSIELPSPREGSSVLPAVRRRLEAEAAGRERIGPLPARALAAAALAAGVALGVWLGESALSDGSASRLESFEPSLAESYWGDIEAGDLSAGEPGSEGGEAGELDRGEQEAGRDETGGGETGDGR